MNTMPVHNDIDKALLKLINDYETLKRLGIKMDTDKVFDRVKQILSTN